MPSVLPPVKLLVEGPTDKMVAQRIIEYVGLLYGNTYGENGKLHLLKRLQNYNQDAQRSPWFAVVDLDQKPDCAPDLVKVWLPQPAKWMQFRVAVRAVEAWFLADAESLAAYLHVSSSKFPSNPDAEQDPKITLVNLARASTKKGIRDDMVPREGSGGKVGPGYTFRITEFVRNTEHRWRPEVALNHSDSLRRCIQALESLKEWQ